MILKIRFHSEIYVKYDGNVVVIDQNVANICLH